MREQHSPSSIYWAQQRAPSAVSQGLHRRIEKGLELPFRPGELLTEMAVEDDGPVAAAILDLEGAEKEESAIGLLAGPKTVGQLIGDLLEQAVLDRELVRLRKLMDGLRDALSRGGRTLIDDARMRYSNQYQRALERIGGDAIAAAVVKYLEEPEFGFEAAQVLKSISDCALNVPKPNLFRRWPWFDGVAAARNARAMGIAPANSYAEPIFVAMIGWPIPTMTMRSSNSQSR